MTYSELAKAIASMTDGQRSMEVVVRVSYDDRVFRLHPTRGPINISNGDDYDENTGDMLPIEQPLLVI